MRLKYFFLIVVMSAILVLSAYAILSRRNLNNLGFPIDLVYMWVNDGDENWLQKKEYWQKKYNIHNPYAVSKARWRDRGELKHSLRSVEQYMPWVRNIFIITDNQIPEWLNLAHPKIKIIDHRDIFPPDALPTFNSLAIETRIPYIKGLSEHFILANDDIFVSTRLSPDFFFSPDGKPIIYDEQYSRHYIHQLSEKYADRMWLKLWLLPTTLMVQKFGIKPFYIIDTHTFLPYLKSGYLEAVDTFPADFKRTAYSKFRNETDLSRLIVTLLDFYKKRIVLKGKNQVAEKFNCKTAGILANGSREEFETKAPCTFCLNDTQTNSDELNLRHIKFMQERFPYKSSFEK